jgi:carbamoylphosphate synthase large subunit
VRPSYVLSGAAMNVVRSESELKGFLDEAVEVSGVPNVFPMCF